MSTLQLRDLLLHARREIEAAACERISKGEQPLIEVQSVTIEVNVVVTEAGEGGGGVDLHVVTASGKKSYENQQVQKITVVLKSIDQSRRVAAPPVAALSPAALSATHMHNMAAPADAPQAPSGIAGANDRT